MSKQQSISSFVRLDHGEVFDRDYYISHTNRKRFPAQAIASIAIGFCIYCFPGIILLLYFALRTLKISHGYACVTNKRVIYYEYNSHPEENYHAIRSLHLDDLTGMNFQIERTLISNSFHMILWSSKRAIVVGAKGMLGLFNVFGSQKTLEPGPDALEFIRDMSGAIAARKFNPEFSSSAKI